MIYSIILFAVLMAVFIWTYTENKKTPVPEGCDDLKKNCEGCRISSCALYPNKEEQK